MPPGIYVRGASLRDRLYSYVNKEGPTVRPDLGPCWVWTGHKVSNGYGHIKVQGKLELTHRVSYALEHGPVGVAVQILHHCDNRPCLRPSHLFKGTNTSNVQDKVRKGRQQKGEAVHTAVLNEEKVRRLRYLYEVKKWSRQKLAEEFEISVPSVRSIVLYLSWKHIA